MKHWSLRSAYNNYEIIVVTANLGVTRRRSLCRHVLLTVGKQSLAGYENAIEAL